ncbi:MAG TPA: condensation domain-containing protein, partial [Bacillota bacterium]|nr:condensation domain-containing protein [Bacillota bacterium]
MQDFASRIAALPPEYRELLKQQLKDEGIDITNYTNDFESSPRFQIEPAGNDQPFYPASAAQKRFYILNQFIGAETSYNISSATRIEGSLDRHRLMEVFNKLLQRHEAFRTTFELINGELVQRIHQKVELPVEYQELDESGVAEVINRFVQPFDLGQAPLLRVKLLKIAEERYILLCDMDH